ncbi:MAG: hypothetical protein RBG13Loki_1296 [Promethearchaeota archaeon CR_4]|nr:MAG: hypothetical protein RBG13Loki_1296 [Candidatus Lokiarchaeota archaeon CR_4]
MTACPTGLPALSLRRAVKETVVESKYTGSVGVGVAQNPRSMERFTTQYVSL